MGFLKELGEFLIKISEGKLQFKADVHFLENVKDIKDIDKSEQNDEPDKNKSNFFDSVPRR